MAPIIQVEQCHFDFPRSSDASVRTLTQQFSFEQCVNRAVAFVSGYSGHYTDDPNLNIGRIHVKAEASLEDAQKGEILVTCEWAFDPQASSFPSAGEVWVTVLGW
ncbi:hypothetical protein ACWDD9_06945 [Kitasatospora sp. NPDC001119]|uniref:hypothetical protein n=1 Tax=Kitasatospora sp. MY 5-36 TaxID=1678027 RepID=UPI000671329C|nr:hypothetical protein [Kitasatospora sp. MY 5-36]